MPDPQTTDLPVTLSDIEAAASLLEGQIVHTPLNLSRTLSHITGAEVWVKFENQQFTAAFKERGALNKLSKLTDDQKQRGVIAASAGNHSQGVAYHARRLGIPATIVMAKTTPFSKVEHTRSHGARVLLEGLIFDEAKQYAMEVCERDNLTFLHPFDDPDIIAGQGTIALEMLAAQPDLDTLVVPIGGGGLISGIAIAAKALKPDIQIIGVEAAMYPCMHAALRGETPKTGGATIAEGIAVKEAGELTRQICAELVDDIVLVEEEHLLGAAAGHAAQVIHLGRSAVFGFQPGLQPGSQFRQRRQQRMGTDERRRLGSDDRVGHAIHRYGREFGFRGHQLLEYRPARDRVHRYLPGFDHDRACGYAFVDQQHHRHGRCHAGCGKHVLRPDGQLG